MLQNSKILIILAFGFLIINNGFGITSGKQEGGLITGMVLNERTDEPVEYAYIILYSKKDSAQVTGTITDKDGRFLLNNLQQGNYYVDVQYIGYKTHEEEDVKIDQPGKRIDLGTIFLGENVMVSDQISVEAERAPLTYEIDKKVINVSQQQTALSGTAVDVLENIPSVTVDIEGNVQLRGSGSFVVMIDDIPTVLEPSDVLQQIPASTIEDIEIITNPSAKFDPDGTSGIINIKTKKNELRGFSGIANVNSGLDEKYGFDFILNFRKKSVNYYIGGNIDHNNYPGSSKTRNWTSVNDTISYNNSTGSAGRLREGYDIRGGMDLFLSRQTLINLGFRFGDHGHSHDSRLNYLVWTNPGTEQYDYTSKNESKRGGNRVSFNLDFRHKFTEKDHELIGQVIYQSQTGEESSIDELHDAYGQVSDGRKTTEDGPSSPLRLKLDYTLPLSEHYKLEAGYQSRLRNSTDKTTLSVYNIGSQQYELLPEYNRNINYKRNIHSLYAMNSGEFGSFGYQGGIRGEYTYRDISLTAQNEDYNLDRWDIFPTLHFSYKISEGQQTMLSYTKRIERPRGYHFEPFLTWMDAYNVRQGNPGIKPEYIDSYEMGYQTFFGKNLFSVEAYYRVTDNKIEHVESVYAPNVTLHSVDNVGTDYTFGTELMLNMDVTKIWNVNLMGNLYNYKIKGDLLGEPFSRESFNWTTRFNNNVNITKTMRFQANARYNSPTVTSQGTHEGFLSFDLALRQEFLSRTLSATLQVRDVFGTSKHESVSEGPDFYRYGSFTRKSPVVMLNLSYKLNNYKQDNRENEGNGNGFGEDEF